MSVAAVNRDVRVEAGTNGTVVVMSAYCARCAQAVMPRDDGSCSWCGTVIVDEDTLPAGAMIAQLADRKNGRGAERADGLEETPGADAALANRAAADAGAAPSGAGVSSSPPSRMRGRAGSSPASDLWSRDRIIDAIRAHAERTGFVPGQRDFSGHSTADRPNLGIVKREFGSWGDAVEAAGYPRPHRGVPPVAIADLEGSGREPQAEPAGDQQGALSMPPVSPPAGATAEAASRPDNDRGRTAAWTRGEILVAIRGWAGEHGQPPVSGDWTPRVEGYPSTTTVAKHFGSWAGGIEAAGFPRPTRGHAGRPGVQQPPKRVRVNGTGLTYRSPEEAYVAADEIEADGERVASQARFDGDEGKAEKARDQSRELAEKIRDAAHAFEARAGHAASAYQMSAEPLPEPTADSDLQGKSMQPEPQHLLVKPEEMAPFQRALVRGLIAGMRAAAEALEQELVE